MSERRPFDFWHYRIDNLFVGEDEPAANRLLDEFDRPQYLQGGLGGLSAIAAALQEHGQEMTADQLEKAVWWLKDWQMHRQGFWRTFTSAADYAKVMQGFKETREFRGCEKRARWYMRFANISAAVATLLIVLVLGSWGDAGWLWRLGWTLAVLIAAGLASGLTDAARLQWQTQDRVYFLTCLRSAQCTEDLLDAGLFAHHEDTMQVKDLLRSRRTIRQMQRQLAQALYFDYDECIRENLLVDHAPGLPPFKARISLL